MCVGGVSGRVVTGDVWGGEGGTLVMLDGGGQAGVTCGVGRGGRGVRVGVSCDVGRGGAGGGSHVMLGRGGEGGHMCCVPGACGGEWVTVRVRGRCTRSLENPETLFCSPTIFGLSPPPGGDAPSVIDLVMSVRLLIHPKP